LGIVASCLGLFLVAQWVVGQLGRVATRAPLSVRVALRDLARYRSRSGAALGAVCLAIVMTGVVVVAANARYSDPFDYVGPNLTSNVVIVYPPPPAGTMLTDPCAQGSCTHRAGAPPAVHHLTGAAAFDYVTHEIAHAIGATSTVALYASNANLSRTTPGRGWNGPIYVGTPALLAHYGIAPSSIDPGTLVLTARPTLPDAGGLSLTYGGSPKGGPGPGAAGPCPPGYCVPNPKVQEMAQLPAGTSAPNTVFTMYAVRTLHLQLSLQAYQLTTPSALTTLQKQTARTVATGYTATIETASSFASLNDVLGWSILIGLLLALGVLAMTVGLIRAETAGDLRVLTAAGASRRTRRALTSITAGTLGLVGGVLGIVTAYLLVGAFLANNFSDNLSDLTRNLPLRPLGVIVLGLPVLAAIGGWVFAAREPTAMGRQPLE